jgi:hypothetical protein
MKRELREKESLSLEAEKIRAIQRTTGSHVLQWVRTRAMQAGARVACKLKKWEIRLEHSMTEVRKGGWELPAEAGHGKLKVEARGAVCALRIRQERLPGWNWLACRRETAHYSLRYCYCRAAA